MLARARSTEIRTATISSSVSFTQLQSHSPSFRHSIFRSRQRQRKGKLTAALGSEETTKERQQEAQIGTGSEQKVDSASVAESDMLKESQKSLAAMACSQAVDGLDKLLSIEQPLPQPLRHRSKALRALDFAGVRMHDTILSWLYGSMLPEIPAKMMVQDISVTMPVSDVPAGPQL